MNISKSRKYYLDKVAIDKKKTRNAAYKIQVYNNNLVDKYVRDFNEGHAEKPKEPMLIADLSILNRPDVYSNYQRILNHPYVDETALNRIIIKNAADKNLERVVTGEMERIVKNMDYVDNFLKNNPLPQQRYEEILNEQKNRSYADRREILHQVALEQDKLLTEQGINIPPNVFSYRNPDLLAESLMRESQMASKYEEAILVNEMAESRGEPPVYTKKRWIWTGEGKTTRHESSNMQEVDIDQYFTIVNDATLDIDELMYPCDPSGSPSNTYICYCECEYYGDGPDVLGGVEGLTPQEVEESTVTFDNHLTVDLESSTPTVGDSEVIADLTFDEERQLYSVEYEGNEYYSDKQLEIEELQELPYLESLQIESQKDLELTYGERDAIESNITWDCECISAFDRYGENVTDYFIDRITRYYCSMTGEEWMPENDLKRDLQITMSDFKAKNEDLHSAMEKTEGFQEYGIVFRGGRCDEDVKVGDKGTFKGYTSVSFQEGAAELYASEMLSGRPLENRVVYEILITPETKCLALNGENGWTNGEVMREVHELLLDKNLNYEVLKVKEPINEWNSRHVTVKLL